MSPLSKTTPPPKPIVIIIIFLALTIILLLTYIQHSLSISTTTEQQIIQNDNNNDNIIVFPPQNDESNNENNNIIQLIVNHVQDKTFIVVQTDTRLRKYLNPTTHQTTDINKVVPPPAFSKQIPLVSVLSMYSWATSSFSHYNHDYGYLFLDIDAEHCTLPPLKKFLI
jgi:hypothetical protein